MYICFQQNVSVKGVAYIPPSLWASVGFTPRKIKFSINLKKDHKGNALYTLLCGVIIIIMEKLKWIESGNVTKTFRLEDEPELIHVIKTGFKDNTW